jgi:very-short-patch-repair endonuclease
MTIVQIEQITKKRKNIILKCDECYKIYNCEKRYKSRSLKNKLHFCSKQCSTKSGSNGVLKNRFQTSILNKFGSFYVETSNFKQQQKELCLRQYGVESRLEAPEILDKIKKTCIEKYGKETFGGSEAHKNSLDYNLIAEKAWKTKIKNGSCSKSNIEEKIAVLLSNNNIVYERQVPVIKQWVDFYLPKYELYLQIDGSYWHGLNRPREIIALQKTSQDKKIYKQILRDEKLNLHMIKNNLKLLRLTDQQINKMSDSDIINCIKGE